MTKSVPHMGKIGDAKLDQCPALDECFPGLEPLEYNLIVAPAVIEEKTQGGLILPEIARERIDLAMQIGRVVAVSPIAFNYDKWPDGTHPPEPGDIVWFARYAGGEFIGMDGRTYRLIKDKDVGARVPATPESEDEYAHIHAALRLEKVA